MTNEEFNRRGRFASSGEESMRRAAAKYNKQLADTADTERRIVEAMRVDVVAVLIALGAKKREAEELAARAWRESGVFYDTETWLKAAVKLNTR